MTRASLRQRGPGAIFEILTILAEIGFFAATFFAWFGPKLSGVPDDAGFIAFLPKSTSALTAWEASTIWSIFLTILSALGIGLVGWSRRNGVRTVGGVGLPLVVLGLLQAISISLFSRFGVEQPFPTQSEMFDGHRVTIEFGLLMAGKIAWLLAITITIFGSLMLAREIRRQKMTQAE